MTLNQKIRALRAQIKALKSITFTYKGTEREGNPHTLGLSNNKYAIRLYQTDGKSSKGLKKDGSVEDFRFFYLEDIDKIEELMVEFEVHKDFQRNDDDFEKIDTQVKKVKSK